MLLRSVTFAIKSEEINEKLACCFLEVPNLILGSLVFFNAFDILHIFQKLYFSFYPDSGIFVHMNIHFDDLFFFCMGLQIDHVLLMEHIRK